MHIVVVLGVVGGDISGQDEEVHGETVGNDGVVVLVVDDGAKGDNPIGGIEREGSTGIKVNQELAGVSGVLLVGIAVNYIGSTRVGVGCVVAHREGAVAIIAVLGGGATSALLEGGYDCGVGIDLVPETEVLRDVEHRNSGELGLQIYTIQGVNKKIRQKCMK